MYHKTVTLQIKERWSLPGEGRERRWIEGIVGVCFPLLGIVTLHCQRGVLNHHGSPLGVSRKEGNIREDSPWMGIGNTILPPGVHDYMERRRWVGVPASSNQLPGCGHKWSNTSSSCSHDHPAMMSRTLKRWAEIDPAFCSSVRYFYSNEKKSNQYSTGEQAFIRNDYVSDIFQSSIWTTFLVCIFKVGSPVAQASLKLTCSLG